MSECLLALIGGLFGSAHCVGMCGGLVVQLSVRGQSPMRELHRQFTYAIGRVMTYVVLGLGAGFLGWRLRHSLAPSLPSTAILSIIAGLAFLFIGLDAAGVRLWRLPFAANCRSFGSIAQLYGAARQSHVALAGMLNGFLPCGLVYSFLAVAFATGDFWHGGAVMASFGMGTIPALAALGVGAASLPCHVRQAVLRVGGGLMIAMAIVMLWRGGSAALSHQSAPTTCPLCMGDNP